MGGPPGKSRWPLAGVQQFFQLGTIALSSGDSHHHAQAGVNLTDIIWRSARVRGFMFSLFSRETIASANEAILGLLGNGSFHPAIARTFPLEDAAAATRYLIEDRPYGRVVLSVGDE